MKYMFNSVDGCKKILSSNGTRNWHFSLLVWGRVEFLLKCLHISRHQCFLLSTLLSYILRHFDNSLSETCWIHLCVLRYNLPCFWTQKGPKKCSFTLQNKVLLSPRRKYFPKGRINWFFLNCVWINKVQLVYDSE